MTGGDITLNQKSSVALAAGSWNRAEVIAQLSTALDLTNGEATGQSVRTCWIGMQIGLEIGLDKQALSDLYYCLLLKEIGASAASPEIYETYQTDDLAFQRDFKTIEEGFLGIVNFLIAKTGIKSDLGQRFSKLAKLFTGDKIFSGEFISTRARRGEIIAKDLGFPDGVGEAIASIEEHWDGKGYPNGLKGDDIPLNARIALLAQIIEAFYTKGDRKSAIQEALNRSGRWFDPRLVSAFIRVSKNVDFWINLCSKDLIKRIHLTAPSSLETPLCDNGFDNIARRFGEIVDAKSNFTHGHSARVAYYSELMGSYFGLKQGERRWLRRAALLHDLGKLGISNMILDKPDQLNDEEREAMRVHGLIAHPALTTIDVLNPMISHNATLEGKAIDQTRLTDRIIRIADAFDALTTDRPWRPAMNVETALETIESEIGETVDHQCVAALQAVIGPLESFHERFGEIFGPLSSQPSREVEIALSVAHKSRNIVSGL